MATKAFGADVAIGVFAYQGERAAASDWSPVIRYLNQALPEHHFRLDQYDAAGLRDAIATHRVDLVITNPGYYVSIEAELGISRIATLDADGTHPARALGSVVVVRANRPDIQVLADLAGKRVAAVAPDAFGGYLVAAREMLGQGVDPESDLKEIRFVGLPMNRIIEAVQAGEVDAGIVRACLPEQMASQGLIRLEDFRALSVQQDSGLQCSLSTRLYPNWPIAVTRHTDPGLAKAVARALLAMPESSGMSWAVPADYQPVHDLYRELRIGPYAYMREITPEGLARRFWPWLLGLLAILTAWIVHTVRIEHQVHRRTAELRDSLAARDKAEAKMRESQDQMEHLSRLSVLGELSGNLAHELNQPLTTIGTYARTVLRRQERGNLTPEAITEASTEIAREAERAAGIVQRIRHFARKRRATREPIDLAEIAKEARHLLVGMLARAPEIVIENHLTPKCTVLADSAQIQQVLLNLIKNAIDACRDLPMKRQNLRIVIEPMDNRVAVHVIDHGIGLDVNQLPHLFEPFFTTKPDGLGLGLPICMTIIEAHGGRLWAEPNKDAPGMHFSFTLPCHELSA
ncbi:MAG: sensor histidine kinase [Betaproteobacteria bacterium HGW-Betaproteobacteria-7]|nr:MAG: sensor histidine kinase [Betaproteobacteria bacterium HGW-Betaproteobacteria-7]